MIIMIVDSIIIISTCFEVIILTIYIYWASNSSILQLHHLNNNNNNNNIHGQWKCPPSLIVDCRIYHFHSNRLQPMTTTLQMVDLTITDDGGCLNKISIDVENVKWCNQNCLVQISSPVSPLTTSRSRLVLSSLQ